MRRWCARLLAFGLFALALPAAGQAPQAPGDLVAEAGVGRVVLGWTAPVVRRLEEIEGVPVLVEFPANLLRYELSIAVGEGPFGAWTERMAPSTSLTVRGLLGGVEHTFRLRAVNGDGAGPWAEARATPAATPSAPGSRPIFADAIGPDLVFRVGSRAYASLPHAIGTAYFDVQPLLPDGLLFNDLSAEITGTPTVAQPRTSYTLTAFDSEFDQAALPFTIEILEDNMPAFDFDASIADQIYQVGVTIETLELPRASGGDGTITYRLTPRLPAGLALDSGRLTVDGTPTEPMMRTIYTWTATDEDGDEVALTFAIVVEPEEPDLMPEFGAGVADQTYRAGSPVDALRLPEASGGDGALSYRLTPALPAGLALDIGARTIDGTPTVAAGRTIYTWTATDEDGDAATVTFAIEVEPDLMPTFGGASIADQSYRVSTAIIDLVLPLASAGDGSLTYSLTPGLPPGLSFDLASRTISGTPTEQAGRAVYSWVATDEDGDTATLTFAIEVGMAITVSIADASAPEGETLSFPVTLSAAVPVTVTVAYRTVDGSAESGEDFTAASGTLAFAPGSTALSIDVAVTSDPKAETDETFAVVLEDLVNAEFGDAEAMGTITDDDMEDARGEALDTALGAFGKALVADAVDAVSSRFQEGPPTGQPARSFGATDSGWSAINRFAADALAARDPFHAQNIGAFDAFDGSAWMGRIGRTAVGGPSQGSFQLPLANAAGGGAGQWTLWGSAATSRVASESGFAVDGRIDSGHLGMDVRLPRNTLIGMAVTRSTAAFEYQRAGVAEGEIDLETTALLPYVHWTLCNGLDLWAMAGTGNGEATLADEFGQTKTDTSLRLAAFGLRHELATTESLGWALKADAVTARLSADETVDEIVAAETQVERLRLMVEGRREWPRTGQAGDLGRLGASFEFGARLDGGDGDSGVGGFGAEVGAALDYRNVPLGLGFEARGRYLLAHAESEFENWGLAVALDFDPGTQGSGASLRVAPAWGTPSSGVADMWRADRLVGGNTTGRGFPFQRSSRLDVEAGYGFSTRWAGPLRLYGVADSASSSYRLGARTVSANGLNWRVEVDRMQRFVGGVDHGILLSIGNAAAAFGGFR